MDYWQGVRVCRGKDYWSQGKTAAQPGYAGRIISLTTHSDDVYCVEVLWDIGTRSHVNYPGSDKLYVLNTAALGVEHPYRCHECSDTIRGFCWACSDCVDVKLCDNCYHNRDAHSKKHAFMRYDDQDPTTRIDVGTRSSQKKHKIYGLYKGAKVVRPMSESVRNANDTTGVVTTTTEGGYCIHIRWKSGKEEQFRIRDSAKPMDLICKKPAPGGSYYLDHLPTPWQLADILGETSYVSAVMIKPDSPRPEKHQHQQETPRYVPPDTIMKNKASQQSRSDEPSKCEGGLRLVPPKPTQTTSQGNDQQDLYEEISTPAGLDNDSDYLVPINGSICAKAKYDCFSVRQDDLSFSKGDIIHNIVKENEDDWIGECKGQTGYFPAVYVEILP